MQKPTERGIHYVAGKTEGGAYSRITPQIQELTRQWDKNAHIDRQLYEKYDVKRGLRDATGRGVLTSLTRISEVKGYTVDGQDTIPCPGVLYYRGYDVRDLVQGALADKRFGFEEVFYLLREDKRFTDLEAWATRCTPCRTPRAEVLRDFVERLAAEKGFGGVLAAYQTVEQEGKALLEARTGRPVAVNVDFYSGLLYRMLGLPQELFTPLFAIARMAGWSAHRMEELGQGGKIIRPATKCVEKRRAYVPMDER